MRAHEFLGTQDHRPSRKGARPKRGHSPVERYHKVKSNEGADERVDELMFKGVSQCTKDCSGHRAGYEWFKSHGGVHPASWSDSFNRGAAVADAGY